MALDSGSHRSEGLPPRLLPALAFGGAHLALVLAGAALVAHPGALSEYFYQPRTVAIVHLVTLGWIGLSIAGAFYIIGPLALRTSMPVRRGDYVALAAIATGAAGVVAHAWLESYSGMAWSGALLLPGFGFIGARVLRGLRTAPVHRAVTIHLALGFLNFMAAGGLGVLVALHKHRPFLGAGVLPWVFAHAHIAALGWVAMLVFGTGYRLLPMILPSAMPRRRSAAWSAVLLQAGVVLLPAGFVVGRPALLWAGAGAAAGAFAVFLAQVRWMLRNRRRPPRDLRRPDIAVLHAGLAVTCGGIALLTGLALATAPAGADRAGPAAAYGVLLLLGFLAQMVAGVGARILPMHAAVHANRGVCITRPPISPHHLASRPAQIAGFVLWAAALALLLPGALAGSSALVRAGGAALLAAAFLGSWNLARILGHAFRPGPCVDAVPRPGAGAGSAVAGWAVALLALSALSCSSGSGDHPGTPPGGGTARMAQRLQDITRTMDPLKNRFMNQERVRILMESVARAQDPQRRAALRFHQADELLKIGSSQEAIAILQELLRTSPHAPGSPEVLQVRALLATAFYRLGIQENCAARPNPYRCILPIEPDAVHTESRGTRAAFNELLAILKDHPDDVGWRWLLNVASMALGEWPDKVPEMFRVPRDIFHPEFDIGRFPNRAARARLDVFNHAGGVVMDDFDGDGLLDLMVSSMGLRDPLRLFINLGDGTFAERSKEAGLEGLTGGLNLIHADYDNDGDLDAYVLRGGWMLEGGRFPNSLLRNDGRGHFEDVTEAAGILTFHPTQAGAWGDYDGDGWLDLFVGNESLPEDPHPSELWRNNGDGTFSDRSVEIEPIDLGYVKGAAWGDYNNDGRPDLYVSVKGGDNYLFRNDGRRLLRGPRRQEWWFTNVALPAGVTRPQNSFPTWFWDYDNDGWLDLFVGGYLPTNLADAAAMYLGQNTRTDRPRLYRNRGDGTFEDVSVATRIDRVVLPMGCNFGDLDNDGWPDAYFGVGQPNFEIVIPNRLFRNDGGRNFQDVTTSARVGHLQKGHGVAFGDLDNDGDQDIFEQMGGFYDADVAQNVLYVNPGHGNHWITLRLEGRRSNRSAFGARLRLRLDTPRGERTLHAAVDSGGSFGGNSLQQEIGLGDATTLTSLEVRWPVTGRTQTFRDVAMDRAYRIVEGEDVLVPVDLRRFSF